MLEGFKIFHNILYGLDSACQKVTLSRDGRLSKDGSYSCMHPKLVHEGLYGCALCAVRCARRLPYGLREVESV